MRFSYCEAFSRNLGWVSTEEQQTLRGKRIAIAGLGGVGGSHLLTLARLGVGAFHLADFDSFDLANFNRQAGAGIASVGRPKSEVLAAMARDINPELDLNIFPAGVTDDNLAAFFDGVDLYVDGLDFFAFHARQTVFAYCAAHGIPAVTAAPLGMGAAVLNFLPGKMSFEEYFRVQGKSADEQAIRFLLGLSPAMLQRSYLVDRARVNLYERRGPSTAMACQICAGLAATESLKILLKRGKVRAAPWGFQFDAYRNKFTQTWRPFGNSNPLQWLGLKIARRFLKMDAFSQAGAAPPDLKKIATAYSSPPWWYDLRGFFILTFAYQSTLWSQIRFFERNVHNRHLEVAMGTGTLFKMILQFHKLKGRLLPEIVGMDYSESMLAGARRRFASYPNVTVLQQDVTQMTASDGAFQSVNIANSLHCFADVDLALQETWRVLASGGTLAVNILLYPESRGPLGRIANAINKWGIKKGILVTPYKKEEARNKLMAAGFQIIEERVSGNCYSVLAQK